jgi:hypothetical protein
MRSIRLITCSVALAGCGSDGIDGLEPFGGSRTISGTVVDFETGAAVSGPASVSTSGVVPAPLVSVTGSAFTIEGIPDNSTFQILASAQPTHRATFRTSVEVITDDLDDVDAPTVSETYLASLSSGFGVTPSAARGVLLAQLVDGASGQPRAGIAGGELIVAGGVMGPYFLDANMMPAPNAMMSSSSGYVVFYEVPSGLVTLGQAAAPTVTLEMPASPVNPAAVTLATIKVTSGAPELPTNMSFAKQIVPIFTNRGCIACHSGGGIGKDLGGLKLDGPVNQVYSELMEVATRVVVAMPENSKVLTMPSRETPPDAHPNVTFASSSDPDYLKLRTWISEGAKNN